MMPMPMRFRPVSIMAPCYYRRSLTPPPRPRPEDIDSDEWDSELDDDGAPLPEKLETDIGKLSIPEIKVLIKQRRIKNARQRKEAVKLAAVLTKAQDRNDEKYVEEEELHEDIDANKAKLVHLKASLVLREKGPKDLICPSCAVRFDESDDRRPWVMPCGHSYCYTCAKKEKDNNFEMVETEGRQKKVLKMWTCPIHDGQFEWPNDGLDEIYPNRVLF